MKNVNGSIAFHVLFHVHESTEKELVELIVRHIVIFDFPGSLLHVHIVGRICKDKVCFLPVHQPVVGFRERRVTANHSMFTQMPNIPGFGEGGFLQFFFHVKVIFLDVLAVDFGKELLHFRRFKTGKVYVEVDTFQVNQKVCQELFIPSSSDFIEGYIESLYFMLVLDVNLDALNRFIAQILENGQSLMPANDGHVIVHNDGFHVTKLLDGVLDFFVFLISRLELFSRIVCSGFQLIYGEVFPLHLTFLHVCFPFQKWLQGRSRTHSGAAVCSNFECCLLTALVSWQ